MNNIFSFPDSKSNKITWGTLYGSALALAISEYHKNKTGLKLLIAQDNLEAERLKRELEFFLEGSEDILFFPDSETLPYDQFSPHQDLISERLFTLSKIAHCANTIIISSVSTLMHKLCPLKFLRQEVLLLKEGQKLAIDSFRSALEKAGYRCQNQVYEHGEYALRGSILDIFPMGSEYPFRIELFDETIESLRLFSPDSQRTIKKITEINILPAREFPLNNESITLFRQKFREIFPGNPSRSPLYNDVTEGLIPHGIEYYLPLFFEETANIFDYLPDSCTIFTVENTQEKTETFWKEVTTRYEQRNYDVTRPLLKPEALFLNSLEFLTHINQFTNIRLQYQSTTKKGAINFSTAIAQELPVERKNKNPLINLEKYMDTHPFRYLLVVESNGRREVLLEMLQESQISAKKQNSWNQFLNDSAKVNIIVAPLFEGVNFLDKSIAIIVENQLFGEKRIPQRRTSQKQIDPDLIIRSLAELRIGAPVVHLQFGVGRYLGLTSIENQGTLNEFLILAYAGNDKIYVPVTSLNLINRYTGADSDNAPLHRLGESEWQKEKQKAALKINDVAIELLEIYAKRAAKKGFSFTFDNSEYQKFADAFPFTETPDQLQAIEEIIKDMQAIKPMDRLICGDVGFGKTEVAMRAAFIAINNNKQVCVLVPTTLLASQHYTTFKDRFADFPVNIGLLSRFNSSKETSKTITDLSDGKIDILIGTHKLLQKNIKFKDLGLLIIDEEHRFGVKQKEHIKGLRANIDILSMTATPIPRTLNLSLAGIRDVSLIATPPLKRLAIKTFWQEKNNFLLREALLREILRGGQVFFLHNNVQTIQQTAAEIQNLISEAKVKFAHGQMREKELEQIMTDFYHNRFNVLVCTTIIETGIDIPTANTIIIDRADKFGLAQLHQLRGRVGRSHHQAYAYLLTPNEKLLTADAKKRLEAIVSFEDLGSGFTLATLDLEIRGAGELLGEGQSGNMLAIGFDLYMDMLNKAVKDLKSGKIPQLEDFKDIGTEIDLRISAIIPEEYINDVHLRLTFYKRISNATNKEQLRELQIELIDRFGLLPQQVKYLFIITEIKHLSEKMGIKRIHISGIRCNIEFNETPNINTHALINLIQTQNTKYQLKGSNCLLFNIENNEADLKISEIQKLLIKLQ